MVYLITEITREKSSGYTYLLVDFWRGRADFDAGRPSVLTNDFVMQLHADIARVSIDESIRNYWRLAVAHGWTGDHTADTTKPFRRKGILVRQRVTPPLERDATDNGIIKRQEIKDLVGVVR